MARKPVKNRKIIQRNENKGNIGEEKRTVDSDKFEFCDQITRRSYEGKGGS